MQKGMREAFVDLNNVFGDTPGKRFFRRYVLPLIILAVPSGFVALAGILGPAVAVLVAGGVLYAWHRVGTPDPTATLTSVSAVDGLRIVAGIALLSSALIVLTGAFFPPVGLFGALGQVCSIALFSLNDRRKDLIEEMKRMAASADADD